MFHDRTIKEKLLKGGAWAFAGKVVTALTGLAVSALLARLLTPEEMGAYFLILSLVSVFAIVTQLGMSQIIVKLVAESMGTGRPSRARESVIIVLRAVVVSSLLIGCLLAFGVWQWIAEHFFKSKIILEIVGLAAVWVFVMTFQSLLAEVYRGFHDIRLATIFGGLTTSVLSMGLFFALWLMQGSSNLDHILILTLGAGLSSVLVSSAVLWKKLSSLPLSKNNILLGNILKESWPLLITSLSFFLLFQADLWFIGGFRTQDEVAVYGAATRTVALVVMPLMIINAVAPPLIAEMNAQGKTKELEELLRKTSTIAGLPAVVILGLFMMFGDYILKFLFGDFYQEGYIVLAILSAGQLFNVWAGSCGLVLMHTGQQFSLMIITIGCGFLMIAVAWWMVIPYAAAGVATAAALGLIMQNIMMLILVKKKVGIWTCMSLSGFQKPLRGNK